MEKGNSFLSFFINNLIKYLEKKYFKKMWPRGRDSNARQKRITECIGCAWDCFVPNSKNLECYCDCCCVGGTMKAPSSALFPGPPVKNQTNQKAARIKIKMVNSFTAILFLMFGAKMSAPIINNLPYYNTTTTYSSTFFSCSMVSVVM